MKNKVINFVQKQHLLFLVIIMLFTVAVSYRKVPFLFFQQDELLVFSLIIERGINIVARGFASGESLHFIPILNFIDFILFQIFSINHIAYNLVGLFIHFLNGFLVYTLAFQIINRKIWAVLATALFLTSSLSAQLVMWPLVSMGMLALTFALLTWLYVLETKRYEFRRAMFTAAFLALSLFTAEYSAGLMLFIPIVVFFQLQFKIKPALKFLAPTISVSLIYILLRIPSLFYLNDILSLSGSADGVPHFNFDSSLWRLAIFPLNYLGQLFIPEFLYAYESSIVEQLQKMTGLENLLFTDSLLWKVTSVFGGVLTLLLVGLSCKGDKWSANCRHLVILLIFIFTSIIPFTLLPGTLGNFALFPPRYLYFGIAAMSLMVVFIGMMVFARKTMLLRIFFLCAVSVIIILGVYGNTKRSDQLYSIGQLRGIFLNEIRGKYPELPQKVVFYTESDKSYYGLPETEHILPFQSGLGQTLLIWFYPTERFPKEFYKDKFLWDILAEGYRESGGRGFGYFRDFDKLADVVRNHNIPITSIVAYNFNSTRQQFTDISQEVQGRLVSRLGNNELISQANFLVSTSENGADASHMIDGNKVTFWSSLVPYARRARVEVTLNRIYPLASVTIDSYNNKNQNEVGYRLLLSSDGEDWIQVFQSDRYPPKEDGIVKLYFRPTKARYIRVEQIGYHEYAPWVINELNIYESLD